MFLWLHFWSLDLKKGFFGARWKIQTTKLERRSVGRELVVPSKRISAQIPGPTLKRGQRWPCVIYNPRAMRSAGGDRRIDGVC